MVIFHLYQMARDSDLLDLFVTITLQYKVFLPEVKNETRIGIWKSFLKDRNRALHVLIW